MGVVLESLRVYRNLRSETETPVADHPEAWIRPSTPGAAECIRSESGTIARLARLSGLTVLRTDAPAPPGTASAVTPFGEHFLVRPAAGTDSTDTLAREQEKLEALLEKSKAKLADSGFRSRAPAAVIAETEEKVRELAERIGRIAARLKEQRSP